MADGTHSSTEPTIDPMAGRPTWLGHPRGLFLLFLVEMWERFSYYGMRGLLVLYLTAALAVHELGPGVYTNTLQIEQSVATPVPPGGAPTEPVNSLLEVPLVATVGGASGSVPMVSGESGPLRFERLGKRVDPAKPGRWLWEPVGEGVSPVAFAAAGGVRPDGDEVRYRITNPTDVPVKLVLRLKRPFSDEEVRADPTKADQSNPDYKVYFKVNDGTSVISTNIHPEAKRDPRDDPFEMSIDINRVNSGRSWLKADASNLYGWYTGMAYLLPILGGLIADKLIGTHRSMVVGGLLIAMGHIALGVSGVGSLGLSSGGMTTFVFGLAVITIGTGHFKPSVSVMVGQLYPLGDPRRESAFSIFYMGINLGAFLCNIVCGYLAVAYGWHYGFAAAAAGMLAGLGFYLALRPSFLRGIGLPPAGSTGGKAWAFLPIGIVISIGVALLFSQGSLKSIDWLFGQGWAVWTVGIGAVLFAVYFVASQEPGDRGPVATIFIYMLFNAVFWLAFEQAGSSLNTFTDELTDRRIGALGTKVPTTTFQSLNPLLIIIFAPILGVFWASLARRNKSWPQPVKIGLGLVFVGLGYVIMVMAAMRLNLGIAKVSMIYICGTYFLHTVGEIILSPTGLSYVAKTAPKRHVSTLMGLWFISSFMANLAAGKVAALVDPIIEGQVKLPWNLGGQADFFLLFVVTSCLAGVLVLALSFFLVKLQRTTRD